MRDCSIIEPISAAGNILSTQSRLERLAKRRKQSFTLPDDRFSRWAKTALALGRPEMDSSLHLEQALTLGEKTFLTDDVTEPSSAPPLSHLRRGRPPHAILFGIFFRPALAPRPAHTARTPAHPAHLVLRGFDRLARFRHPRRRHAHIVIISWLLKRPSNVLNSLFAARSLSCCGNPTTLSGRFSTLLFRRALHPPRDANLRRLRATHFAPRPLLPDELRPLATNSVHAIALAPRLAFSSLAAWIGSSLVKLFRRSITHPGCSEEMRDRGANAMACTEFVASAGVIHREQRVGAQMRCTKASKIGITRRMQSTTKKES